MGEDDVSSALGFAGRTKNGDVELAYERADVDGDPLLLIAGHGAAMNFWHDGFREELLRKGFEVARFDNRDAGLSSRIASGGRPRPRHIRRHPEDAPYLLEDMADDASAVLDALGFPSAHVVGHSLGGMIAQMLAIRHPTRVRSLTTIASTPAVGLSRTRPWTFLRLLAANPTEIFGRGPRSATEAGDRLLRVHRIIGSRGFPVNEEHLRGIAATNFERGSDPAAMSRQECAAWASGDLRPALRELKVAALVVHGSDDILVRPNGGTESARSLPGAEHMVVVGMGHDLPNDVGLKVARKIRKIADAPSTIRTPSPKPALKSRTAL